RMKPNVQCQALFLVALLGTCPDTGRGRGKTGSPTAGVNSDRCPARRLTGRTSCSSIQQAIKQRGPIGLPFCGSGGPSDRPNAREVRQKTPAYRALNLIPRPNCGWPTRGVTSATWRGLTAP